MSFAPIALFAYRRPSHTLRALEALAANEGAERSPLYVFCDAASAAASADTHDAVREVRDVVRSRRWCATVTITLRDRPFGLARSLVSGISEVVSRHGEAIVMEDDLVTSPRFLSFMNRALDHYRSTSLVYGISGYSFVDSPELPDVFLLPVGSSWGWATWQRAWTCFDPDARTHVRRIQALDRVDDFDFAGFPFFRMLKQQAASEIDSWAINYYASFFLQGGYFAFPRQSLVENIGFDGHGSHGEKEHRFRSRLSNDVCEPRGPFANEPDPGAIRTVEALMRSKLAARRTPSLASWKRLLRRLARIGANRPRR